MDPVGSVLAQPDEMNEAGMGASFHVSQKHVDMSHHDLVFGLLILKWNRNEVGSRYSYLGS